MKIPLYPLGKGGMGGLSCFVVPAPHMNVSYLPDLQFVTNVLNMQ